jgi:tripartite-type tricarboxylate transporter receptor subunit TctC
VKKGTPADRVAALRSAIGQALVNPEIRAKLELEGSTASPLPRR